MPDSTGARPPDGTYVGIIPELTWDRYHWHDLVPSGYRIALELRPGYFFGADQPRHEAKLRYLQGIPLAGTTVVMINSVAEAVNRSGNPNHSVLLGSIAGIRGLFDNLFRNRAQVYTNLELRHAVPVAPRWALQGVLFSDFGAFQSFTEQGHLQSWKGAVNIGGGVRIVPTFLANTLLRVDVAQLWTPSPNTLSRSASPSISEKTATARKAPIITMAPSMGHIPIVCAMNAERTPANAMSGKVRTPPTPGPFSSSLDCRRCRPMSAPAPGAIRPPLQKISSEAIVTIAHAGYTAWTFSMRNSPFICGWRSQRKM